MAEVRVMGPLEVVSGDTVLHARDVGVKPRQVLSILVVHRGRAVTKERIADLLWGDALPQNVAATLETYVSNLRRVLKATPGVTVITDPGAYRIATEGLDTDLDQFDRLRASAAIASRSGDRATARKHLDAALALIRGEVFAEEAYATWAIRLREQYRERQLGVLLDAAEAALADGDHAVAHERACALFALDRAHEAAYRIAMQALRGLGRSDEALRLFERARAALREELGAKPAAATQELYDAIRRGDRSPAAASRAAVALAAGTELPLLGRVHELATLERAVHATLAGPPALLVVEGEAGIGKSRVLDELAARLTVAKGKARCYTLDRDLAFAALAQAVRELAGADAADADRYPALGEILPELGHSGLPPESARSLALESLVRLVASRAPVVLVFDDLQWADASTITAIGYLLRRSAPATVAVIAGVRDAGPDHPLRQLPTAARIELLPLSRAELADHVPANLVERTGGHPLFLVELLRAGAMRLPETLRELLLLRSTAAGEEARRVLAVAAVLGRAFSADVLARMLDVPVDDVLEQLDTLCEHRLLAVTGEQFDFRHALVREALEESLSAPRRRRLHVRAFAALEQAAARPAQLAYHAEHAGMLELAVRCSQQAATAALAVFANVEAAAHLERALAIATANAELVEPEAIDQLHLALGRVLVKIGRTPDAEDHLRRARAGAESRGDDVALFDVLEASATARHRGASAPTEAAAIGRAALEIAVRLDDPARVGRGHLLVGGPLGSVGQLRDALSHCHAALSWAERAGVAAPPFAMGRIALMMHFQGDELASLQWGERAETAALEQHDEETLIMVRWVRALSCTALGRCAAALRALDAIRQVGRGEELFWHARVPNTYGALYADLCLYDRALERDLESLAIARTRSGNALREAELQTQLNVAADRLALGQIDAARAEVESVRAQISEVEYARFRWVTRMHLIDAQIALAAEDPERAARAVDSCLVLAEKYEMPRYTIRGGIVRAEVLAATDDTAAARRNARAAAERAEQLGYPALAWRAWQVAGDSRRARRAVVKCAEGLEEPLRGEFLAAVPVPP